MLRIGPARTALQSTPLSARRPSRPLGLAFLLQDALALAQVTARSGQPDPGLRHPHRWRPGDDRSVVSCEVLRDALVHAAALGLRRLEVVVDLGLVLSQRSAVLDRILLIHVPPPALLRAQSAPP